jgi:hypothetical protein
VSGISPRLGRLAGGLVLVGAALALTMMTVTVAGASGAPLTCGGSASDPSGPANAVGYHLEPGITAMNRQYVVRAIGPLDPSVSAEINTGIARIDQLTGAQLVRGADEPMPPNENPTIFPLVPGEIDVFTNTWNTGTYAPYFGDWTYMVPVDGRSSGAVISITMGITGSMARPAVWHELGHAVGLDHYFSSYLGACQMMSYGNGNLLDYQTGDRNGLIALADAGGFGPPAAPVRTAPAPAPPPRPLGPRPAALPRPVVATKAVQLVTPATAAPAPTLSSTTTPDRSSPRRRATAHADLVTRSVSGPVPSAPSQTLVPGATVGVLVIGLVLMHRQI